MKRTCPFNQNICVAASCMMWDKRNTTCSILAAARQITNISEHINNYMTAHTTPCPAQPADNQIPEIPDFRINSIIELACRSETDSPFQKDMAAVTKVTDKDVVFTYIENGYGVKLAKSDYGTFWVVNPTKTEERT